MLNPCPKEKYFRSKPYLTWLRKQMPLICGTGPNEAHHLKCLGHGGTGIKPPDNLCIPIPQSVHYEIHFYGELRILNEKHGYNCDQLRKVCETYFERWLLEKE